MFTSANEAKREVRGGSRRIGRESGGERCAGGGAGDGGRGGQTGSIPGSFAAGWGREGAGRAWRRWRCGRAAGHGCAPQWRCRYRAVRYGRACAVCTAGPGSVRVRCPDGNLPRGVGVGGRLRHGGSPLPRPQRSTARLRLLLLIPPPDLASFLFSSLRNLGRLRLFVSTQLLLSSSPVLSCRLCVCFCASDLQVRPLLTPVLCVDRRLASCGCDDWAYLSPLASN